MIGRCGLARPASLVEWWENRTMGGMTETRVGHGTQNAVFDLVLFGNGTNSQLGEVWLRILLDGTLNWSFAASTQAFVDLGKIDILESNSNYVATLAAGSGTSSSSGTRAVTAGQLLKIFYFQKGSTPGNLDKITTSFWIAP